MKRIVIGSMIRSGSTWTYNAVRLLAEELELDPYVARAQFYDPDVPSDLHIVRAHIFEERLLPAIVITNIRDLRDAVASAIRLKMIPYDLYAESGLQRLRPHINNWIVGPSLDWTAHADHVIKYEEMLFDKEKALEHLALSLFPEADINVHPLVDRLEMFPGMSLPARYGYSPSGRHRTNTMVGGYRNVLRAEDAHMLTVEHRNWLVKFGYDVTEGGEDVEVGNGVICDRAAGGRSVDGLPGQGSDSTCTA